MRWVLLLTVFPMGAFQAATDASTSSPDLALHYPSAQVSQAVAREMLDALDEEYARVRHELGCVIGAKITAIVIPLASWEAMGNVAWSGGMFDGRIQVPLVYERSRVGPRMRKVFAHEIVHACIARFGQFPTWLHEGLAQRLSGEMLSHDARRGLQQALEARRLPALEQLAGGWSGLSGAQASLAYAYALWAAEVWTETEGAEAVRQLLQNPGRVPELTGRLNEALRR